MTKINFHRALQNFAKQNLGGRGQSLIGIIIVLVMVGLFGSGLYYYLSKQILEIPEITEKPDEEIVKLGEEVITPPEEKLPKEEIAPEEKVIPPKEKPVEKPVVQKCADGTLYGQCSVNKPKYCDNGNLVDRASLCGCPSGYKIQEEKCVSPTYIDEDKIIIFREKYAGEILRGGDQFIDYEKFREQFYKNHEDRYDFLILFPTTGMQFYGNRSHSVPVNRNERGIGWSPQSDTYSKRLKTMAVMSFYQTWTSPDLQLEKSLLTDMLHEIGHHWCCFLDKIIPPPPTPHWPYNLDLFNGNPNYLDIMTYNSWIRKDSQEICVYEAPPFLLKDRRFSDLTLYLMGLIPKEKAGPIYLHEFEKKANDPLFNAWGPNCFEEHKFTNTKAITIQDIIEAYGKRLPAYEESQKDFTVAFVILTEKDATVPTGFINYVNEYRQALPETWNQATVGKSKIKY